MTSQLKIEIVAQPGAAPDAVLFADRNVREFCQAYLLAELLLAGRAGLDANLSYEWGRTVICTPEFSAWWRGRADRPASAFFVEVEAA
jgi:hypothetical protein